MAWWAGRRYMPQDEGARGVGGRRSQGKVRPQLALCPERGSHWKDRGALRGGICGLT